MISSYLNSKYTEYLPLDYLLQHGRSYPAQVLLVARAQVLQVPFVARDPVSVRYCAAKIVIDMISA